MGGQSASQLGVFLRYRRQLQYRAIGNSACLALSKRSSVSESASWRRTCSHWYQPIFSICGFILALIFGLDIAVSNIQDVRHVNFFGLDIAVSATSRMLGMSILAIACRPEIVMACHGFILPLLLFWFIVCIFDRCFTCWAHIGTLFWHYYWYSILALLSFASIRHCVWDNFGTRFCSSD